MTLIEISDYERWKQQQAQRTAAGANVVLGSIDTKPDDVAGDMNLGQDFAKTTGQPVPPLPLVTEYRPVFQQAIERSRNATILSGSPMLASWLKKPENAAIARDDLEGLSALETTLGAGRNAIARGLSRVPQAYNQFQANAAAESFADRSRSFGEILADTNPLRNEDGSPRDRGIVPAGPDDVVSAAWRYATSRISQLIGDDDLQDAADYQQRAGEIANNIAAIPMSPAGGRYRDEFSRLEPTGSVAQDLGNFFKSVAADPGGFTAFLGEVAAESLPTLAATAVVAATTRNTTVAATFMGATSGIQEAGVSPMDLLNERGLDVSTPEGAMAAVMDADLMREAEQRGMARGVIIGALDGLSGGIAGTQLAKSPVGNAVLQSIVQATLGGTGEALAQVGSGQEFNISEVMIEALAEFVTAPIEVGSVTAGQFMRGRRKARDAEDRQAVFQELSGQAVNSRLRARMPDAFRQFVERATENGPVENVFVPAEKFQEYFQGIGTDPFALADELDGVSADALRDALATGGDLQIPTATYAASIAGSEHDAFLMENMRFDPDEFTSFEAREFNEKAQEALEEAYAEAEDMRRTDEALRTFEQEIYDTMVERLRIAGRSTDVATSEAMLFPAFYRTMAERSGMPIDELMRRYPLPQVQGELPQGIQNRDVDALSRTLAEARSQRQVNTGPRTPLLEFISDYGGMIDAGGELASRDAALIQRGRGRTNLRLLRDPNTQVSSASAEKNRAFGVDDVAQAAIEAGFMAGNPIVMEYQESLRTGREAPDITRALFDEIDREMRGEASLTQDELRDGVNDDTLGGLEEYLSRIGMSLDDSDADIRAAIERDQAERGAMYGQDGQIDRPLYVVHNLSATKLEYATELGGLAAPSLAVARGDIGFDNFGEISLIGDPSMADPRGRGVRAFNADVYSPRQPRAQFKVKEKDADRVFKAMRSVADDLGFEGRLDTSDLSTRGVSEIAANVAIKAAWLRDQGETLPVQYDDPIPAPVPVAGYEAFTSTDIRALLDDPAFEVAVQTIKDAFVAERADTVTPEQLANIRARLFDENGKVTPDTVSNAARNVANRNGQIASYVPSDRGAVNKYRTSVAIDEQIAGREDDYSAWVRSQFGDVIGDAYFEDANGRRREYTMANIVREMTRGLRDAEGFNYGVGNVRATVAPEFKTMTEIKAARGQVVDSETMDRLKTEVGDELFALADKFAPYHSSGQSFGWGDIFSEFLKDMGKGRRFVEEWQGSIFSEPVPDALLAEAAAYLQKLRDLPTEYFEIKMQRAVGLDEFKVALVPENASDATVKTLTDAGLEVLRYGVEGRQAALQRVAGKVFFQPAYHGTPHLFEKFSLSAIGTGEGAQAFGWGLYFAGRKEVAEFYRNSIARNSEQLRKIAEDFGLQGDAAEMLSYQFSMDNFHGQGFDKWLDGLKDQSERGWTSGRTKEAVDQIIRMEVEAADAVRAMRSPGRLFEVNIPEDAELLDWDAPLSEQPEAVREKLQPMLDRVREIDRAFIADQRQAESEAATSAPISDEMAALLDDLDLPDVSPEEQAATDAAAAAREAERVETLLNLKWGDSKKVMGLHAELAGFFAENDAAWSLIGKTPDDVMNTQQAASELLRDAGIPGHRYLDGGSRADGDGSRNYVIYDDSRIDVARFEQENRGSIQFPGGGVGNGDTVINLFRKADLSTFLHESGHYFLTVLQDMARQGETAAVAELDVIKSEWRKNAGAVAADAMRVMPDVTITEADVNTALDNGTTGDVLKDAAIDVGMQEQFARGFERYLMEGKAPTQELRSAFEKFRAWLMSVYKSLRGLNVEISDEMRAVFDRMLATDAEIATASEASGDAGPLFATAEDMGLSADDYAAFLRLTQQANDEASAKLLAETMAPIRRETEKWFKDERAKVRADVEREVNAYRQYRALEWMGNRRWLGEGKPEALGDFRLSKDMLVERYGAGVLKTLPRGKQTVYAVEGGMDPDVAADLFGYSSADEMIKSMEQAPPRREAIEAETDRKMFELHGDPLKDGSVQQQALDAVHGDKRARALAVELKALADIAGSDRGMTHKEAREIARQTLNRTKVRDAIASNRYLSAERKAGEEARRLSATVTRTGMWADAARRRVGVQARAGVREGDTAAPARVAAQVDRANTSTQRYNENVTALVEAKRRQLMNHALYSEARRIEAEVQSAERLVTRLSRKSTREKLAGDYLEAIDELLMRYDFRRMSGRAEDRRGALAAFIERMTAEGRENELAIPDRVLQDTARTPYKKLTVEHLRGVVDSLKNIEHTARLKKTLQDAQSQRELDAVVDDITAAFDKNLPKRPPGRVGDNAEGRRNTVRRFLDLVLNATTLLREIDGREDFGPAYRNIKAPIDAAMNRLQGRRQKAAEDLDNLYEVYTKKERRAMAVREFIPEVDASLSKWERIAVALNMGNEGNYQRMTDTSVRGGFTEAQVDAIVATLDERDAAFVQSVWNYLETFRPDIEAREKRTTGVAPKWVEARPVEIAGRTLNGGYYPLRYDPRLSALARDDQAQDISKSLQAGRFGKAQTRNGHLKERAQSSGRAVELDIAVLHQHVQQVVYDIELSEPVNNSWRILQDARIREAFTDTGKQADFDALEVWLKDVAEGEIRSSDAVGKMARRFKSNFTAAKLAFNLSTVAVQITGVSQSMVVVGKKDFLNGVVASMRPGVEAEIIAKSQFMRDRQTTFNKDIFDLYNDPKMGPAVGRWTEVRNEWIAPAGFWLMTKVQFYTVDLPSWMAGYQQGLRKFDNNEDMAIAFADDVVKRAQASGLFSDRSAIERGSTSMSARQNDFIRLFTTLGSYMFAKFNVAYERTQRARGVIRDEGASMRSVQEAFSWTLDMAFLFTLEAILYMAIKGRLPDEEDDEDGDGMGDEWATFLARETALSIASSIPFVRDLGGIYAGFSGGGAYGAMTEELTRPLQQAAQGEVDRPFVKSIINATGLFTGLPTGQINRAVDAGWRQAEGEDVSPAEYILGRMGN